MMPDYLDFFVQLQEERVMTFCGVLKRLPPWLLSVVCVAVVLYLTIVPKPLPDNDIEWFEGADKVVHALMMFGVTGALSLDFIRGKSGRNSRHRPLMRITLYTVAVILLGGAIELLQGYMGLGRGEDMMDFVADTVGAVIAWITVVALWSRVYRWLWADGSRP